MKFNKIEQDNFEAREEAILKRIQIYYSQKLGRVILTDEAKDIALNLLNFAKAIYGK